MTIEQYLLLTTYALSLYGVGQVWLVQLSSYRLWQYVGANELRVYHLMWWHSIWVVVLAPAVLVTLGSVLMLWWRAPGVPVWGTWLGIGLQLALVLGTALWWAPLMMRIEAPGGGLAVGHYHLLMVSHWLRVAIITAYGILMSWMVAKSAWRPL